MTDSYTDPDELFDVCDVTGQPTGAVKRRADVHRDGDWHRSVHCWVTLEGGDEPELLIQQRGAAKDTWPGRLDATVGGHFRAGETLEDALRESEEEIGVAAVLSELVPLGRRISAGQPEPGVIDREIQEVYVWRATRPLDAYHPRPVELTALAAVPLAELLRLHFGQVDHAPARKLYPDGTIAECVITRDQFVPTPDRYFYRVAIQADLAIRGYPYLAL